MNGASRPIRTLFLAGALGLFGVVSGRAQERDEYGEVQQTVARVADIDGSASYSRGDDPDNWQAADQNVPMTSGDRIYSDERSRVELGLHGGAYIRVGAHTDLATLNLTDDTKQFALKSGVASFHLKRLDEDEVFEVDTPNAAVTFQEPGRYRIDVDPDGNTRVSIRAGRAEVSAGGGTVSVREGEAMTIEGSSESPRYDVVSLDNPDGWDRWVGDRESRVLRSTSYRYVNENVVGGEELDQYGRWEDVPQYGHCWTPSTVSAGWVPYRIGHWVWQDPWGWTWISGEPWGWAPYHYGRWVSWSSRWFWVPIAPRVAVVAYSPALVAFVGGGPGFSASVSVGGGGFVGWFPLAPQDPFVPWWAVGPRTQVNVNVTNVTYVNRTYVTVVNQNTFVTGGVVTTSFVRDQTVIRTVNSAAVVRGPLPMLPTQQSLRVAVRPGLPAPRPPAAVVARSVVVRVPPPAAPPTFQQKLAVIRQNNGRPVAPGAAATLSAQDRSRAQAITAVRPVAAQPGRVTLAPRAAEAGAKAPRPPQPVVAERGRPLATAERPVTTNPMEVRGRRAQAAAGTTGTGPREQVPTPAPGGQRPGQVERPGQPPAPRATPVAPGRQTEQERVQPSPRPQPTGATPEDWRQRDRMRPTPRAPQEATTPRPEDRRFDRNRREPTAPPEELERERGQAPPRRQPPTPRSDEREVQRERRQPPPTRVPPTPRSDERELQREKEQAPPRREPPTPRAEDRKDRERVRPTPRPERTPEASGQRQPASSAQDRERRASAQDNSTRDERARARSSQPDRTARATESSRDRQDRSDRQAQKKQTPQPRERTPEPRD